MSIKHNFSSSTGSRGLTQGKATISSVGFDCVVAIWCYKLQVSGFTKKAQNRQHERAPMGLKTLNLDNQNDFD